MPARRPQPDRLAFYQGLLAVPVRPATPARWLWPLVAVAAGVLWALCFGTRGLVLAPWLALAPLFLLLDRTRPVLAGLLHGIAFWLTAVPWIQPTLRHYGGLPPVLAALALAAACLYLALYTVVFAAVGTRIWRRGPLASIVGLPALWVAIETLRGWGPMGFPWNLAAYAWVEVPGALPLTAWVGSWGLSYLVVAVNVAMAIGVERRDWRIPAGAVASAVAILALGLAASGAGGASATVADAIASPPPVHLLQPNSAVSTEFDEERVVASYQRILEQSAAACTAGPGLLVWPEGAAWPFSYQRHRQLQKDVDALARRGCPVLLNSTVREADAVYNAVFLATDQRAAQRYEKRRLVPFGEFFPLPSWVPGIPVVARDGGFTAGRGETLLEWGDELLGPSICFEIVFPGQVARQVQRGATLLVTVTNDGWYGDSSAPWQHFRAARFRAAENRRVVLRAAITGVSGVIAPDGEVLSQLGVGETGVLSSTVVGERRTTFFSRAPWLVPALCWGLIPFAIFRLGRGRTP